MSRLPIITALGGINAAGRSSSHHAYRRLVFEALDSDLQRQTLASLAALTGSLRTVDGKGGHSGKDGQWQDGAGNPVERAAYLQQLGQALQAGTLIRKLEDTLFDPDSLLSQQRVEIGSGMGEPLRFSVRRRQLPSPLPPSWNLLPTQAEDADRVLIEVRDNFAAILPSYQPATVNSAGQLPSGFDPARLYPARNHPRALQMTVYGASDAINSLGVDWETIRRRVPADQISVYAGSGMGQLDYNGYGGLLQARLLGRKVSSKQLALGYAEMPADFINAYLLGNLGTTGTNVAACATFLYNLRQGIRDIQAGTHRVVIVGTSEAPLVPEIFEGFATMGALADDAALRKLDGLEERQAPDHRRACRPFGDNCGFTLAESAQFAILMDDELVLELGANVLGAVNEVFINADGHKKSIASPGLGNYLSMAKAVAATRQVLGERALRERTYVQAHGTGTPQNRLTESQILSRVAATFGIERWPVAAVKAYVGHSLASSAGDQLVASLGVWAEGWLPGITTIDDIADDVTADHLHFPLEHEEVGPEGMDAVLINSKGFGGNNASASLLAPHVVRRMLGKRHGKAAMTAYDRRHEGVAEKAQRYDADTCAGDNATIYRFDHDVLGGDDIEMSPGAIRIRDYDAEVSLDLPSPYRDMLDD